MHEEFLACSEEHPADIPQADLDEMLRDAHERDAAEQSEQVSAPQDSGGENCHNYYITNSNENKSDKPIQHFENLSDEFITTNDFGKLPAAEFDAEYLRLIKADLAKAFAHRHEMPAVAKRGLTDETIDHFNFGYLPAWILTKSRAEWNCGIYVNKKTGNPKHLPPPSERVIIPTASGNHFNAVATQAARAALQKDYWKQHAGEMELFCDPAALEADTILIVEGEWDAASIWQCSGGKIAVVAILGCANWKKTLLPRLPDLRGKRVVLMLDADAAGKKNAKRLLNELLKRGIPAFYRPLYDVLTPHYRQLYGAKVDANDILQARGDKYLNDLIQDNILGDYTVANLNIVAEEIKQGKYVVEDKPVTHKEISTLNNGTDTGIDTDEIKLILKDFVHAKDLTRDEWWSVGAILYRYGFTLDDFKAWSDDGDSRYDENRCEIEWNGYKTAQELQDGNKGGYTVSTLIQLAKQNGYKPTTKGKVEDYSKLFDGLKPIKICAGSIFNTTPDETKPAFESLFVDRNFSDFVLTVDEFIDAHEQIDSPPFGDYEVSTEQVKNALAWLVSNLSRYFNGDDESLKKFIVGWLQAIKATGAVKIIGDEIFWENATQQAKNQSDGKTFRFDAKFRRELIACASHSKSFFESLMRFDYQRLEKFLQKDFTDVDCAELLVDVQKDFLRFDDPQATWYTWRGNYWKSVNVNSLSSVFAFWTPLARKIRAFAELERFRKYSTRDDFAINNPDCHNSKGTASVKFKRLDKAAKAAHVKFNETATLEYSRSILSYITQASGLPEIQIETSDLDKNGYLFNAGNVTIDLRTMETYKARQSDLITLSTETAYDPSATSDVWTNFLATAIPDENLRDWLQRFFGYALSGNTGENLFVFIHGIGGSGKTTFLNAIGNAMGQYARTFSVDAITENKKQRDGDEPSPVLASLRACRLARSSETKKNRRMDEAIIKKWTGSDKLSARELHKSLFEFKPSFKLVVDGNFALRVTDINDDGLRRRLRIAPFNNPPPADKFDPNLGDKLSTAQTKSAILNWLVEGWKQYQARGLKDIPAVMQTALDKFYAANDTMQDFLEAHDYQVGDKQNNKYRVAVMDSWQTYQRWQRQTPTASMLTRADFVDAFLRATQKDGVELRTIINKQFFVGCKLESTNSDNGFYLPEN